MAFIYSVLDVSGCCFFFLIIILFCFNRQRVQYNRTQDSVHWILNLAAVWMNFPCLYILENWAQRTDVALTRVQSWSGLVQSDPVHCCLVWFCTVFLVEDFFVCRFRNLWGPTITYRKGVQDELRVKTKQNKKKTEEAKKNCNNWPAETRGQR